MEKVCQFLKDAGVYYLATVEGDQPRVRPFGTANIFDGKLYIRKDATIEYVIEHNVKAVTKEELNREYLWFNGVYFDENGYVTRLVYYGD